MTSHLKILYLSLILFAACGGTLNAQTYIELADSANIEIASGNWNEAEQLILKALRMEPGNVNNALLLSNLGIIQNQLGKYDEALKNLSVGLSIAPKSTILLTNRARTSLFLNDTKSALGDLDKALEIDSTLLDARKLRAFTLMAIKDFKKAETDFMQIIKVKKEDADIFSGLAECDVALSKYQEALENYDKSLKIEKDERNYFNKTLLLCELKELEKASESIREAIDSFPESGNLYLLRAYIYKLYYRHSDSERDKKTALDHNADPEIVELLFPSKKVK